MRYSYTYVYSGNLREQVLWESIHKSSSRRFPLRYIRSKLGQEREVPTSEKVIQFLLKCNCFLSFSSAFDFRSFAYESLVPDGKQKEDNGTEWTVYIYERNEKN